MSFDFQKFVKKSTRGLFIFIIATMVLPLVLWGYMGGGGPEQDEEAQGQAGVIFGSTKISKAAYGRALERAGASYWWGKYEPIPVQYMRYMQVPPPTPAQLSEQAWENLILLQEAKVHGIQATEREVLLLLREVYQKFTQSYDYNEGIMGQIARDVLRTSPLAIKGWAEDAVIIRKFLDLIEESEFASYDEVYGRVLGEQKVARVWAAAFEADDAAKFVRPSTTDEVAAYYGKNREKYKVPQKVQASYLMAEFEPLLKGIAEPSADDVKKYYDEHKAEFAKEHHHEPGEAHKEDEKPEYKSFDEVKAEIPGKIRLQAAEKKAAELMAKVDVELGALVVANKNVYPDDAFDQLKAKFKAQNIDLVHDITLPFDRRRVEEVEKTVGANSNLAMWAFETGRGRGDISKTVKTSKGVALFRLNRKIEALDPGVSDRVRDHIVKELQKEQIKKRIQKRAEQVAQEINTAGFGSVRAKQRIDWRMTRYFKVGSTDMGLEDYAMSGAINRQVQGGQLAPGKAAVVPGAELRGQGKGDASYVVYLEDSAQVRPDNIEAQFANARRGQDAEARRRFKEGFIKETVQAAALQIDPSMKKAESKENPTPHP